MLTLEVRRRPGTGAEMHRIAGPSATVGASSGNEVVVRARGVYGRHLRLLEKDGTYHLDLFRGIAAVQVNGREFNGGAIAPGDRITIGEATITVVDAAPASRPASLAGAPAASSEAALAAPAAAAAPALPATEVEYRGLRLAAYRLCREARLAEDLAIELTDFLDRELPPSEWAVGEFSGTAGFRPLASTFRENPALPPGMVQEIRAGERLARSESVAGVLTLVVEPAREGSGAVGILVRESPRLAARAVLFVEELAQLAGVAFSGLLGRSAEEEAPAASRSVPEPAATAPAPESSPAETVLRSTDDLKKIVETVEREVIDRAMRRVEGNQSRGAQILNISRGSLIAKLKEFEIPDYRYLRRERGRRG
ncbi:MAG TPA: helix-turn-helix domain-containing protein [Thermoanaerobaculia bacterium]|nr:helix-turn-helix domain-containing protein [Thermoanaerobaculia bacterium]